MGRESRGDLQPDDDLKRWIADGHAWATNTSLSTEERVVFYGHETMPDFDDWTREMATKDTPPK